MAAHDEPVLSREAVLELARLEGYTHLDADTAARIAVGASNAVRAVTASVDGSLFDVEPLHYLLELERLAGED
ncbi:MAG: hypothetical protein U1F11_08945 [Steroidobacteraceae bacterium]